MSIRIEQSNGSTCTQSSVDDEPIVFGEDSSHSITLAWQFDCSEFGPKWEGDHSKIPVHFGEDKLAKGPLQRVDIEEVSLPVHSPIGIQKWWWVHQLEMLQQFHANMNESGQK